MRLFLIAMIGVMIDKDNGLMLDLETYYMNYETQNREEGGQYRKLARK